MTPLLLILAGTIHAKATPPKWLDRTLAGYSFANDLKHSAAAVFDPSSGFMLIREPECDGADLTLLLTRDRYEVQNMGFEVPNFHKGAEGALKMTVKKLPNLATGKGVRIGDPESRVERVLGKSHKNEISGKRGQFLSFRYQWTDGSHNGGRDYEQVYTFKAGKLIEITYLWSPTDQSDFKADIQHGAKKAQKDRD